MNYLVNLIMIAFSVIIHNQVVNRARIYSITIDGHIRFINLGYAIEMWWFIIM